MPTRIANATCILFFILILGLPNLLAQPAGPCPAGDCDCLLRKADRDAQSAVTFSNALNRYFAVTACDENLRNLVEKRITDLFKRIGELHEAEKTAEARASEKKRLALEAQGLAEAQRQKAEAVLNRIYFFEDRYGLASHAEENNRLLYGFIDKDEYTRIDFKYNEALPFDYSGFARVRIGVRESPYASYMLIDTLGEEYPVVYDVQQLTDKITALDLRNQNLDELPEEVFQNTQLKILLLGSNQLSDLPAEIGHLTNLIALDISRNGLSELPAAIGQLANLVSLDLSYDRFRTLPPEIGQLTNLQSLYLERNPILQELPPEIGQLSQLTKLNLAGNAIKELPREVFTLKNMTELYLSDNLLTELPEGFQQMKTLRILNLRKNQFQTSYIDMVREAMPWCEILF